MRVTIVPEDKYIAVNKRGLNFDFAADNNTHAIQWYGDQGVVELKTGGSRPATLAEVQPFIDAWEAERIIVDTPPPAQVIPLYDQIKATVKKIDADTDAIYAKAIGGRAAEYMQAESDALAYKAAGDTGAVPDSVKSWADATGKTASWAADDTLATATAWRNAQAAIRKNRLACKEAARKVTTDAGLAAVMAQWSAFVTAITASLGV